jgi:hypothetical protein
MRAVAFSSLFAVFMSACTLSAQQAGVTLQHFKNLPPGQYQQTSQAYRGGQPTGQPVVDTHCAAAPSSQNVDAMKQMQAMAGSSCSTKVNIDTPDQAQWLTTCNPGAMQTVIRSTFNRMDDRTITMETNMSIGGQQQTSSHSTLRYLGACPAGMAPPSAPQMPPVQRLSAADCAQLPEMRQQAKEATVESCRTTDLPAAYVARCEASVRILKEHMQRLETSCKR